MRLSRLAILTVSVCRLTVLTAQPQDAFIAKPYLQIGDSSDLSKKESLLVLWHAPDADAKWVVEYRKPGASAWRAAAPTFVTVAARGLDSHRVYRARLEKLAPGSEVEYRVRKDGSALFEAKARVRKAKNQDHRFAVFGDCAADTAPQRQVAYQTHLARPDFVFIPGDIVYSNGRISEYRKKFFPVYNADTASPDSGAPLIRSIPFIAAPGNHDLLRSDLALFPDLLAYFLYWAQPLNGPIKTAGSQNIPALKGPEADQKAFLAAAKSNYPRMANFSFDYGSAHWTVLDSNPYIDWSTRELREWLTKDLAAARKAKWRFVGFHHPGFNSARHHFDEQRMRLLSEVFEAGKVHIVFSGHVHNYQRSFPLTFVPKGEGVSKGRIEGEWKLDRQFDGNKRTRPNGVIYIVSGAGGARLYDPEQQVQPASWQEFTAKFVSQVNSFTLVDAADDKLTLRQISATGSELDRFVVTR
ncbi:MAG: metallophosphoesterase family protein [Bryobacteraceae bacterium]